MDKNLFIIFGAVVALAFFAGRYSASENLKRDSQGTAAVAAKTSENKNTAVDKVAREFFRKDGTLLARVTRTHAVKKSINSSSEESSLKTQEHIEIEARRGVQVSVLAGVPLTGFLYAPVWGASVSKQLIGPISLGAWAFSDLRVGLSIGMEF